jgi:hypothetical protein
MGVSGVSGTGGDLDDGWWGGGHVYVFASGFWQGVRVAWVGPWVWGSGNQMNQPSQHT